MKTNKAIIIVDVQRDFCEGGALGVSGGDLVALSLARWLEVVEYTGEAPLLITTQDWHINPGTHFASTTGVEPDFATTWPDHCVAGTPGAELHDAIRNLCAEKADFALKKGMTSASYSGFEAVGEYDETLPGILLNHEIKKVIVVGLAYDYCVMATAIDSASWGFETIVDTRFTASVDPTNDDDTKARLVSAGVRVM